MMVVAMVTPMSHLIMAIQIYGGGGLIGGRGLFPDSENYLKCIYIKLDLALESWHSVHVIAKEKEKE